MITMNFAKIRLNCFALFCCAVGGSGYGAEPRVLQPTLTTHLSKIFSDVRWDRLQVKDMRATANTIAFLVEGKTDSTILLADKNLTD